MIRMLCMAGGLAGAVGLGQFPEFSQQYLQRMSGAVDELRVIVASFDVTAAASGLTREQALAELEGSAFRDDLRQTLATQIARYDRLSQDYAALKRAEPLQRLAQVYRFADPVLARRTWDDFRPAIPTTADGLVCAGLGFGAGWALVALVLGGLRRMFRRRPARAEA